MKFWVMLRNLPKDCGICGFALISFRCTKSSLRRGIKNGSDLVQLYWILFTSCTQHKKAQADSRGLKLPWKPNYRLPKDLPCSFLNSLSHPEVAGRQRRVWVKQRPRAALSFAAEAREEKSAFCSGIAAVWEGPDKSPWPVWCSHSTKGGPWITWPRKQFDKDPRCLNLV